MKPSVIPKLSCTRHGVPRMLNHYLLLFFTRMLNHSLLIIHYVPDYLLIRVRFVYISLLPHTYMNVHTYLQPLPPTTISTLVLVRFHTVLLNYLFYTFWGFVFSLPRNLYNKPTVHRPFGKLSDNIIRYIIYCYLS